MSTPVPMTVNVSASMSRIELTDQDILLRLKNTEDSTVERKTSSDFRDCREAAVAFSNSLPVDDPGIIFVGVKNDGVIEDGNNLDSLQRKVSAEIGKVYPPIYPQMKAMKDASGKEFLAVIVRGSPERPHFSGPSYIRDGMQTKQASEEQFARLIAERSSKVREILKWQGSQISLRFPRVEVIIAGTSRTSRVGPSGITSAYVLGCNQFWVTLQVMRSANDSRLATMPLSKVEVSLYPDGAGRLCLIVADWDFYVETMPSAKASSPQT